MARRSRLVPLSVRRFAAALARDTGWNARKSAGGTPICGSSRAELRRTSATGTACPHSRHDALSLHRHGYPHRPPRFPLGFRGTLASAAGYPLGRSGMPHHCCGKSALMPTPHCQVCAHPQVKAVNAALIGGEKDSVVARRWKLGPDSVRRHRVKRHFPLAGHRGGHRGEGRSGRERDRRGLAREAAEGRHRPAGAGGAAVAGMGGLPLAAYAKGVDAAEALERIEGRLTGGISVGTINIAVQQTNIVAIQSANPDQPGTVPGGAAGRAARVGARRGRGARAVSALPPDARETLRAAWLDLRLAWRRRGRALRRAWRRR